MKLLAIGAWTAVLGVLAPRASAASTVPHATWSGDHALTIPRGRLELGVLSSSHYGLTERLELSLHPLWFFALPHLEAKALAGTAGPWTFAARARLAYPTWFLGLVSREGAGGLLPKTSKPPQALQIEGEAIATVPWFEQQWASFSAGIAVAPHARFEPSELPLLDFPLLYPRFAPLYTVLVPRARLSLEGHVAAGLFYAFSATGYAMPELPDVGTAYALEPALQAEYRFGDRVALSLGLRTSLAEYAYGVRFHYLPFADARFGF
jgi:hypothetical protein